MLVLGIESSCDDTSVALVECSDQGHVIIAEKTASQIDVHKKYGGVVPEIAGRMHAEIIVPLIEEVLASANTPHGHPPARGESPTPPRRGGSRGGLANTTRPDVIAVTAGPGLITGLIVGVEAARTLSYAWNIPVVAVNHLSGHVHSVEIPSTPPVIPSAGSGQALSAAKDLGHSQLDSSATPQNDNREIQFPALALIVSGGHTELVVMENHTTFKRIGSTKDDAAGECFDKVAKLLGLPYPGGPQISKLAETGRTDAIAFPRPMIKENNYDFSFAGLKTSALYWLRDHSLKGVIASPAGASQSPGLAKHSEQGDHYAALDAARDDASITINDFAASFEQAIVDVLVSKTLRAAEQVKPKTIILAGGVAANKKLRQLLAEAVHKSFPTSDIRYPTSAYCMDNGAMIAVAGYYKALEKNFTSWDKLSANPNWRIDQKY